MLKACECPSEGLKFWPQHPGLHELALILCGHSQSTIMLSSL